MRMVGRRWAFLVGGLVTALAACGGGSAATSTSGTGGAAASSGATTATGSTGSTGGGSPCGVPDLHVDGTLAGAAVSAVFSTQQVLTAGTPAETDVLFCDHGDLLLFGDGSSALLRLPAQGPRAGEWLCAGAGTSAQITGEAVTATLAGLSSLGACPGTASFATVSGCVAEPGSGACLGGVDSVISGTLEGAMFSWSDPVVKALRDTGVQPGTFDLVLGGDAAGGKLLLDLAADPDGDDTDFKILGGVLAVGPGGPDPGAVYCIDSGNFNVGGTPTFMFTALSRLGTCGAAPVDGSLMFTRAAP